MIVIDDGPDLRLVTQPDHARFAADLLALWRADGLPDHPRRDRLLLAVREHDAGWQRADAAPRVDPETGGPYDFRAMPDELRREIWDRSSRRLEAEDPYAAWLVTRHSIALASGRGDDPAWEELLGRLRERSAELGERAGLDERELETDYRLLNLADEVALIAGGCWPGPVERRGVEMWTEGGAVRVDPFPLAGSTRLSMDCRRIPARRYLGDADLGGELAAARWQKLSVPFAPPGA